MKARLLPLLFVAVLASMLASGCTEEVRVENESSGIIIFSVVQLECDVVQFRRVTNWSVVDPGHGVRRKALSVGDKCLVVANPARTDFTTARLDSGATYTVRERNSVLFVQRRGGEFVPAEAGRPYVVFDDAEDASPKLLWVIGLPAVLSALYLGYAGVHFIFPGRRAED